MGRVHAILPLLLLTSVVAAACREDGEIRVTSLKLEGVEQVERRALEDALQTRAGSWLPWGRQFAFDRRAFDADLQRIEAFYRDRGFPDARVVSVEPTLNDAQDEIAITIRISEGEPVRVASLELEGFDALSSEVRETLLADLPLQVHAPLDVTLASASRQRLFDSLRNQGYPHAEVAVATEPVEPGRARVIFRGAPGALAHFSAIEINGSEKIGDHLIARYLTFEPGEVYSRASLRESQRQLYRTELFEFVNVESLERDADATSTEIPVRVTVGEGRHRRLTFGAGYGSEDKLRVRIRWDHLNFLGGGRRLGTEARWSSLDRGVRVEWREPYLFHRDFSLSLQGQAWHADEPAYTQDTLGGRTTLRHEFSPRNFWSVSHIDEYQQSTIAPDALDDPTVRDDLIALGLDPRTGDSEGVLSAIAFDMGRSTTDNVLDARHGYVVNAHLEKAGRWLWGSYSYSSVAVEVRHFQPVGTAFLVASRLSVGTIAPTDDDEANVPFYKRYFLGGASSNRGWGRFEISPLSEGFPIGGLAMLDGSFEARIPVYRKLGAVAFLDYSNVWSDARAVDLRDLRYAAGTGLRYDTPIGPARIDFGYQLNPIEGLLIDGELQERRWRVHFNIGQAF